MSPAATARTVLDRCDRLAALSSRPDGIERVYLSPEHAAANELTATWMREAGLTTWQDAAGNLCGRLEGTRPGLPALLLGSHLDTVPGAGRYDGVLGVMVALAVVERLGELPFAVEVVAFADEEGTRFGATLLGSRALAGTWDETWWALRDADGVSMEDAALAFALDPGAVRDAARRPDELLAYLEVHIEQGPLLEEEDRALGVVTAISGARRMLVTVTGETRHCATPWDRRRDALAAASEMVLAIERVARDAGSPATVGHLRVEPDAVNVIPGLAELSIDLRDADDDARDATLARILAELDAIAARRGVTVTVTPTHVAAAVACDPALRAAVRAGITATCDADPLELPSIAGHDAMAVAAVAPIGMLFVRCGGGEPPCRRVGPRRRRRRRGRRPRGGGPRPGAVSLTGRVDVLPVVEVAALHPLDPVRAQVGARTVVPRVGREVVGERPPVVPPEDDGVPGARVEHRPAQRAGVRAGGEDAPDDGGRRPRQVDERHDRGVPGGVGEAGAQRLPQAPLPVLGDHGRHRRVIGQQRPGRPGAGAEHDDDPLAPAVAQQPHGRGQPRPVRPGRERLRAAVPGAGTGGEDDAAQLTHADLPIATVPR